MDVLKERGESVNELKTAKEIACLLVERQAEPEQAKVILDMAGRIYDAQVKNPGGRVWIPGEWWVKFTRDFSTPGRT